jgi:hypothetical protein
MSQAIDDPDVQAQVKDQSQARKPVQKPGPRSDKIVIGEIIKTRFLIQDFPP